MLNKLGVFEGTGARELLMAHLSVPHWLGHILNKG